MTDKLIEKMQEAISEAVSEKQEGLFTVIIDWDAQAKAALSVIRENASELVKPLVWSEGPIVDHTLEGWRAHGLDDYQVSKEDARSLLWIDRMPPWQFDTTEEAKAAAQRHHVSRILPLLNMEGK